MTSLRTAAEPGHRANSGSASMDFYRSITKLGGISALSALIFRVVEFARLPVACCLATEF